MEKKKNVVRYKNLQFKWTSEKGLLLKGCNGYLLRYFGGKDLILVKNQVFIVTRSAYFVFLKNLISCFSGVLSGYFLELTFVGLGYRFLKLNNYILIKVGQSHYAKFFIPNNIQVMGYKKRLIFFGLSMVTVKRLVFFVRCLRQPDIYKGKGILYFGEKVILKVGKQK